MSSSDWNTDTLLRQNKTLIQNFLFQLAQVFAHIWNQWKDLIEDSTVIKASRYCIQLDTNLLLYAPVILRQVGCDVPIARSGIGEVKGRGAVRSHRQDKRQTGAPECVIGKPWSCRVYDWRGAPSNMAARQREAWAWEEQAAAGTETQMNSRDGGMWSGRVLHGDIALSTVEVVALGDSEEPASDGGLLRYVKPLQPHAAVPAVLWQLLSWFGRKLWHKRHLPICRAKHFNKKVHKLFFYRVWWSQTHK